MYPASKEARADPTSSLRRWFPYAVNEMEQFVSFMETVTETDLRGFWGRRKFYFTQQTHIDQLANL